MCLYVQVRRGGDGRRRCRRVDGGAAAADAGLGLIVTCRPGFGRERGSCCRDPNAEIPAGASRKLILRCTCTTEACKQRRIRGKRGGWTRLLLCRHTCMVHGLQVLLMLASFSLVGPVRRPSMPQNWRMRTMQFQLLLRIIYGN